MAILLVFVCYILEDVILLTFDLYVFKDKQAGLEVSAEKTKYTFMSCHQNAGQVYNIKIPNNSFKVQTSRNESNKYQFHSQ